MVTAMSGVELALWDLAGKAAGVPIYRLMGGKLRDRIRIFQDCGAGDWGWADRESVVEGKSGDVGGRRVIKKKKKRNRVLHSHDHSEHPIAIIRLEVEGHT